MTDADMQALREMGNWLMAPNVGTCRVGIDRDDSHLQKIMIELYAENDERHTYLDSRAPTIAEAWAAIKQQEGFPCD